MKSVRAVLFDVFGTVVDWRGGVAREAAGFFSRRGLAGVDAFAFADAWRERYQPAMQAVRTGERPFTRLDTLHRENLEAVLPEFGVDPRAVAAEELETLNLAWHKLDPWPDVVEGLHRLKRRHVIAPLSNGNFSLLLDMARRAALPWDAIMGAELAGAYKPAPESYLRSVDLLGMAPEEVCLVAAHNGDLAAARRCGLRTAFVPRRLEYGPDQSTDLVPEQNWDLVVEDFGALATALSA